MRYVRLVFLMIFAGSALVAVAQQSNTPLGDVVKHKSTKKASRVYTNEDFPSKDTSSSEGAEKEDTSEPSAESSTASTAEDNAAPSGKKKENESPEILSLKTRLAEVDKDELNLKASIRDIQENIEKEEDPDRRDVLENMLAHQKQSFEKSQSERATIMKRLEEYKKN